MKKNAGTVTRSAPMNPPVPWRSYLAVALGMLVLVLIVGYGFTLADRMNKTDTPALNAVMIAKLEATRVHHRIDKIASGDSFENVEVAFGPLESALSHLQTVLEGVGAAGVPVSNADTGTRLTVQTVQEGLTDLKAMAWQRVAAGELPEDREGIDALYHDRFNHFIGQLDGIRLRLEHVNRLNFNRFRAAQLTLLAICLFLAIAVAMIFLRFERRSVRDLADLSHINRKLATEIAEREAAEKRQAELLSEIRSFAYFVSHDLRAPLVTLKGFVKELVLAVERVRPEMDAVLRRTSDERRAEVTTAIERELPEAIGFIGSSVSKMENMIQAVLRLSRLEHRELSLEPIDMNELVEKAIGALANPIREGRVQIFRHDLPPIVADRFAMERVLSNLLDNAFRYRDPQRDAVIAISGETAASEAAFHIRDNGVGIERGDLDRIFEVFQRAGVQDGSGEGIGLASAKTLIRRHGGRIWCESTPGTGSCFSFTIATPAKDL